MQCLEAVLLAAGSGSRFGGGKLLSPYRGGELIDGALRAALAAPVRSVVVVTGYDGERLAETITAFASRSPPGPSLEIIHAQDYAKGAAASLKVGLNHLPPDVDGVFIFLADMPKVPASMANLLLDAIGEQGAAAPVFDQVRGYPLLFSRRLWPLLFALEGDQDPRTLLDALTSDLATVQANENGILFNVDRWSDLAR